MKPGALAKARRDWALWRARRRIAWSGLFDGAWYLRRYPDVAAAGVDPLVHYALHGHTHGYFPHPLFDGNWYRDRYLPGADPQTVNPLLDYIRRGRAVGHAPNRWFDVAWYAAQNAVPPHRAAQHYVEVGAARHRETTRDMSLAEVVGAAPDLGGHGTPLGCFLHEFGVTGYMGDLTCHFVAGWAHRHADRPVVLTVCVNDVAQGEVRPWLDRPDVRARMGFDGRGFFFSFPRRLAAGDHVEIKDEFGAALLNFARTYEIPPLGTSDDFYAARAAIAATFLHGRGVEIGAFHSPTDVPPDRDLVFYDRFPAEVLRRFYDEAGGRPLMEPNLIGEAETLDGLADGDFDFLIANHVIEHLQDPVRFLKSVAAKLVPGGRAMIAAPDKRHTFDKPRALTPFAHLVDDHVNGAEAGQYAHFLEWAEVGMGLEGAAAHEVARATATDTTLFHYHVWDADSFVDFIRQATQRFALPFALVYASSTYYDITVVLERTA